jgi:hypothetical protein
MSLHKDNGALKPKGFRVVTVFEFLLSARGPIMEVRNSQVTKMHGIIEPASRVPLYENGRGLGSDNMMMLLQQATPPRS